MKRNRNWFWGLFFIVGALILLSSALGWSFGLSLWQWFVVIFMSSIILKSIPRLEYFGIIMPLPFIYLTINQYLPEAYQNLNGFTLILVALFLSIGLSILFKKKRHYNFWSNDGIFENSMRRRWDDDDDDDWDDEIDITFEKKQKTSEEIKKEVVEVKPEVQKKSKMSVDEAKSIVVKYRDFPVATMLEYANSENERMKKVFDYFVNSSQNAVSKYKVYCEAANIVKNNLK